MSPQITQISQIEDKRRRKYEAETAEEEKKLSLCIPCRFFNL
jgi:hypothetical protein